MLFFLGMIGERTDFPGPRALGTRHAARATTQPSGGAVASVTESSLRAARWLALGIAVAVAVPAPTAEAIVVGGGGSRKTDCLAVFQADANRPARRPRHIRCVDGDPCDADGAVDGRCSFPVAVCMNSTEILKCTMAGVETLTVEHAEDNGDPKFDPDFQALQNRIDTDLQPPSALMDRCTTPTTIQVRVRGPFRNNRCKKSKKRIRLRTVSTLVEGQRRVSVDRDTMKLTCLPAPEGCSAGQFFTSTFDRVQRQIFNQSCALSACHDSQAVAGNLLLETGASHTNLVGVAPTNTLAENTGWQRIALTAPGVGDLERSYLLHKVTGQLPSGYGLRMPFGRAKLDRTLIDVITLWIAAGAPADGWVPGTE